MKKALFFLIMILFFNVNAQNLSPYIKVIESNESIAALSVKVTNALEAGSFQILGMYHPANNKALKVIAFTRKDLKDAVVKVADRGALAAIFKIGFIQKGNKVTISYTNPEYILRAYLMDKYPNSKAVFDRFSNDLQQSLSVIGNNFQPFGGVVKAYKLKKYHYKIMMPYFTDPIKLQTFSSFEEGLKTIARNAKAHKGNTKLVYKLVYPSKKIAVFGIGLFDKKEGEPSFLPKIGEAHVAALPYEIILQGTKATMLHGKYRIALHWPELTMGTFMKIMSTPGNIEDMLEVLCK